MSDKQTDQQPDDWGYTREELQESGFTAVQAGLGNDSEYLDNTSSRAFWQPPEISYQINTLYNVYRTSWIARSIVDAPVDDALSKRIKIITREWDNQKTAEFLNEIDWENFGKARKYSRLTGGAGMYLWIEGQDPATPLREETIRPGQLRKPILFDSFNSYVIATDSTTYFDPRYDNAIYQVYNYYNGLSSAYIGDSAKQDVGFNTQVNGRSAPDIQAHSSRVIRFDGADLPLSRKFDRWFWGESSLAKIWDDITGISVVKAVAIDLADKSRNDYIKVQDLEAKMATPQGRALLKKMTEFYKQTRTNSHIQILDSEGDFGSIQYNDAALEEKYLMLMMGIAGSEQIPLTRLLGQSPKGLNATGDSDWENYFNKIQKEREYLTPQLLKYLRILSRNVFGEELPADFDIEWPDLWDMSARERTDMAKVMVETATLLTGKLGIKNTAVVEYLKDEGQPYGLFQTLEIPEEVDPALAAVDKPESNVVATGDETEPETKPEVTRESTIVDRVRTGLNQLTQVFSPRQNQVLTESHDIQVNTVEPAFTYLTGIFMQSEVRNANGRRYRRTDMERVIREFKQQQAAGKSMFGELDHPADRLGVSLQHAAVIVEDLWMEGNDVHGRARILNNSNGNNIRAILQAGGHIGVSSRGTGDVNVRGDVSNFELSTIDVVATPSAPDAMMVAS